MDTRGAGRLGATRRPLLRVVMALAMTGTLTSCAVRPPPPGPGATPVAASSAGSVSSPPTTAAPGSATPTPAAPCPKPPAEFVTTAPGVGRTVALTFDDGPAPADLEIVPILARYGIHATFFETGQHAVDNATVGRYVADHGNLVGVHSWDHRYPREVLGGWTEPFLTDQYVRTRSVLAQQTHEPVCFVRPPGGYVDNVLGAAAALGLTAVSWSVDGLDWKQPGKVTPEATATILTNATKAEGLDHPIVLLHSGKASHEPDIVVSPFRGNTVAALPQIIQWYLDRGYTFVRLDGTT